MFDPGPDITIPPMVSVFTRGIGWVDEAIAGSAPASAAIQGADTIVYFPLILPAPCVVKRLWWANGATASGNVDVGIYADSGDAKPGALIVSAGLTAQTGTNVVQFDDCTDTALAPGRYWLALVCSSATATIFRSLMTATAMEAAQKMTESGASLPSTATPVEASDTSIYLFGFSTVASP